MALDENYFDLYLLLTSIHMQKNNLIIQTFLELLQFQESWNLDWSSQSWECPTRTKKKN